jgi:hypothetical protein
MTSADIMTFVSKVLS